MCVMRRYKNFILSQFLFFDQSTEWLEHHSEIDVGNMAEDVSKCAYMLHIAITINFFYMFIHAHYIDGNNKLFPVFCIQK